jgi:predicted transcriptional regulator
MTGASLDATKEVLLAAITKEPGRRFEEIRLALGRDRADLQLPLRKLVAEGSVKSKGVKRATRYYPASR